MRWILASLHLLALGIGLGAAWARGRALRGPLDSAGLRRVFAADAWWGAAAVLWIGTGLWRLLGNYEKSSRYYLDHPAFHTKMGLLLLILVLEAWPMITLIRWRVALGRGQTLDVARAGALARISMIQAVLVVLMVFAATAMARGVWFG